MSNPPEVPSAEQHRGLIASVIGQVLGYVDRPWKAVALGALVLVGGFGWAIWEEREALIEAWLTPSQSQLKTEEIPEALQKLVAETDADLVQIWAVDLPQNSQSFVGARRRDGERPVIPAPRRLPVIVVVSDVRALINVLEGHPTCVDLSRNGSPLARRLAERGMKRGCAVPIPPNRESFVGVIYLAWITQVDKANEEVSVGVAREMARKLATQ